MKEIIMDLIKKYYSLGHTVKDTVILGQGAKTMVRMMVNRTAIAWQIKDRDGEFDDEKAGELLFIERDRIADQLYGMTQDILISLNKYDEWVARDIRHNITDHKIMMSWCIRALIWMEIISPYDIMFLSSMEKDGDVYGYKREGQTQETEQEKAQKEYEDVEKNN